jgi:putative endonuclease
LLSFAFSGFDSPRLHQPSLRRRQAKAAATQPAGRRRAFKLNHLNTEATARHAFLIAEMKFYYTYILQSEKVPDRYYIGFTEELEPRLNAHNSGQVPHTSKHRPWHIKTAIAFTDRQKALDFETYLKSPSGRAFSKKRL